MSYQICYALFRIWTTPSTQFKTEKSCKGDVNHNITKCASGYSGSPYNMSRDQLYCVMTSSYSHEDTFILSWAHVSTRHTIIYSFAINRFFGIWLVSELFDPPTYIYTYMGYYFFIYFESIKLVFISYLNLVLFFLHMERSLLEQ